MPRVAIDVMLKREILDPEGRTVEGRLPDLGYDGISDVRAGKHFELTVEADDQELEGLIDELCRGFLTNPVIETYAWRVIEA